MNDICRHRDSTGADNCRQAVFLAENSIAAERDLTLEATGGYPFEAASTTRLGTGSQKEHETSKL
jgi:hypothetical protein